MVIAGVEKKEENAKNVKDNQLLSGTTNNNNQSTMILSIINLSV